jgi:hypothetical protein
MADNRLLTADMPAIKTYNVVSEKGADIGLGGLEVKHSLLLALAASVASASMAVAQDSPVTLRWAMSADSQAEIAVWNHLADMVHAKYPAITVKFESTASGIITTSWQRKPLPTTLPALPVCRRSGHRTTASFSST